MTTRKWTKQDILEFADFCREYASSKSEEEIEQLENDREDIDNGKDENTGHALVRDFGMKKIKEFANAKREEIYELAKKQKTEALCKKLIASPTFSLCSELSEHLLLLAKEYGVTPKTMTEVVVSFSATAATHPGITQLVFLNRKQTRTGPVIVTFDNTGEEDADKAEKLFETMIAFFLSVVLHDQNDEIDRYKCF